MTDLTAGTQEILSWVVVGVLLTFVSPLFGMFAIYVGRWIKGQLG